MAKDMNRCFTTRSMSRPIASSSCSVVKKIPSSELWRRTEETCLEDEGSTLLENFEASLLTIRFHIQEDCNLGAHRQDITSHKDFSDSYGTRRFINVFAGYHKHVFLHVCYLRVLQIAKDEMCIRMRILNINWIHDKITRRINPYSHASY